MHAIVRCSWPGNDPLMIRYHDEEWGVPVHDDRKWFEFMVLDAFQAGLSWRIVLNKREGFDAAFSHFEPAIVASYSQNDVERLIQDSSIIRNRQKIEATVKNALHVLAIQREFGTLDAYLWQFTDGQTIVRGRLGQSDLIATSPESDALSKDLRARGFKFVGSTICYAFMQSAGMVNDHAVSCFRYKQLVEKLNESNQS